MIQPLSQRDKRWGDIRLGYSNTLIKDFGCTITAIAMILGTTPDVVNERLKLVGGFAEGNLVIWDKLEQAFPGIKVRRVWTYNNDDVKANVKHVLVEVDGKPIGGFRHWVVYVGNQKLYDPWDGKEDPTSDYPNPLSYCVLEGEWNQGKEVKIDLQKELDEMRNQRDDNNRDRMALFEELGGIGKFDRSWAITEIQQIKKMAKESGEKDNKIKNLRSELEIEKGKLLKAQEEIKLIKGTTNATTEAVDNVQTDVKSGLDKIDELGKQVNESISPEPKSSILDIILEFLSRWKAR